MSMCPYDRIHPAVQVVSHCQAFTRRLAVETDERLIVVVVQKDIIRRLERAVDCRHETSPLQIDDQELSAVDVDDCMAPPRCGFRIVQRPDHIDFSVKQPVCLTFCECMVSERYEIGAISEQLLIDVFGDALAMGGILTFDDSELCAVLPFKCKQMIAHHPSADFTDHVAYK